MSAFLLCESSFLRVSHTCCSLFYQLDQSLHTFIRSGTFVESKRNVVGFRRINGVGTVSCVLLGHALWHKRDACAFSNQISNCKKIVDFTQNIWLKLVPRKNLIDHLTKVCLLPVKNEWRAGKCRKRQTRHVISIRRVIRRKNQHHFFCI